MVGIMEEQKETNAKVVVFSGLLVDAIENI